MRMKTAIAALAVEGLLPGQAQYIVRTLYGPESGSQFGAEMATGSDIDGDGVADLVVGAPRAANYFGSVLVYSGKTGRLLLRVDGPVSGEEFGAGVAFVPDQDQDGRDDLLVGAPGALVEGWKNGAVYRISTRTGQILGVLTSTNRDGRFGAGVARFPDADHDGIDEFVVLLGNVSYMAGMVPGSAQPFSGRTLAQLGPLQNASGAARIHGAGDWNFDGTGDWVTEAKFDQLSSYGVGSIGSLPVYFGGAGAPTGIHIDDRSGDRVPDVLFTRFSPNLAGVFIETYPHGALLRTHVPPVPNVAYGKLLLNLGDIDGDGAVEYAVGTDEDSTNGPRSGMIDVFSGLNGTIVRTLRGDPWSRFGNHAINLPDLNGDGIAEFAVSATFEAHDGGYPGAVHIVSPAPLTLESDRHAVPAAAGGTQQLSIDLGAAQAGCGYLLVGSMTGYEPPTPFGSVSLPLRLDSYSLLTASWANGSIFANSAGVLDANGRATCAIHVPAGLLGAIAPVACFHAVVAFGPGGQVQAASNAVSLLIE